MSPRCSICLSGLLSLVCCLPGARDAAAQDLFPDKNLESAVRKYVFAKRNNNEPLTADDVKTISTVTAKNAQITNLQGMEACIALALFDIEGNAVEDLTPIKDLSLLQSLNVGSNKVKDLTAIGGLAALQYLDLSDNQIADITALAPLERLTTLYLSGNQIKEIKTVGQLKKLWSLHLDGNPVEDISPVAELTRLTSLGLQGCGVSDLAPLKGLTQWQYLLLQDNKITDLSVLVEMAKQDAAGEMRFAPFWRIYLEGNPLSEEAKTRQAAELKSFGGRVFLEKGQ